jgi:hypothetical protein
LSAATGSNLQLLLCAACLSQVRRTRNITQAMLESAERPAVAVGACTGCSGCSAPAVEDTRPRWLRKATTRAEAAKAQLTDLGDARLETPLCFFCASLTASAKYFKETASNTCTATQHNSPGSSQPGATTAAAGQSSSTAAGSKLELLLCGTCRTQLLTAKQMSQAMLESDKRPAASTGACTGCSACCSSSGKLSTKPTPTK